MAEMCKSLFAQTASMRALQGPCRLLREDDDPRAHDETLEAAMEAYGTRAPSADPSFFGGAPMSAALLAAFAAYDKGQVKGNGKGKNMGKEYDVGKGKDQGKGKHKGKDDDVNEPGKRQGQGQRQEQGQGRRRQRARQKARTRAHARTRAKARPRARVTTSTSQVAKGQR